MVDSSFDNDKPRLSPDGGRLYFQSNPGRLCLRLVAAPGSENEAAHRSATNRATFSRSARLDDFDVPRYGETAASFAGSRPADPQLGRASQRPLAAGRHALALVSRPFRVGKPVRPPCPTPSPFVRLGAILGRIVCSQVYIFILDQILYRFVKVNITSEEEKSIRFAFCERTHQVERETDIYSFMRSETSAPPLPRQGPRRRETQTERVSRSDRQRAA